MHTPTTCQAQADGTLRITLRDGHIEQLGKHAARLIALLLRVYGGALPRALLVATFWDLRRDRRPTLAQQATINTALRRLRSLELVVEPEAGLIALTSKGVRIGQWLTTQWDGWSAYATAVLCLPDAQSNAR